MKFSFEDHDGTTVLTISGELTADQADSFRRSCLERFASGIHHVVLDLEHLTLVDSEGLEMLLWLREAAAERQGQLRLVKPDATVRKILEITRLDRRFETHDTVAAAAKSMR
jgi:anti-sigma B factor antagonist